MASSCQIGPLPSEGRSSSCFALNGVKRKLITCGSKRAGVHHRGESPQTQCATQLKPPQFPCRYHKCSKRRSARLQDGLLRRHATGSSGRPYASVRNDKVFTLSFMGGSQSHESLGRDKRFKVFKPVTSFKHVALTIMMMLSIAKGLELSACQIGWKDLLDGIPDISEDKLIPATEEEKELVSKWDGKYVADDDHTRPACINRGTLWYKASDYSKMDPETVYEVHSLLIKKMKLIVITATDQNGSDWLVTPVSVEILDRRQPNRFRAKLAFVELNGNKKKFKRRHLYCFSKPLTDSESDNNDGGTYRSESNNGTGSRKSSVGNGPDKEVPLFDYDGVDGLIRELHAPPRTAEALQPEENVEFID